VCANVTDDTEDGSAGASGSGASAQFRSLSDTEGFFAVFMQRAEPALKYDALLHLDVSSYVVSGAHALTGSGSVKAAPHGGEVLHLTRDVLSNTCAHVHAVLSKALSNRVVLVSVLPTPTKELSITPFIAPNVQHKAASGKARKKGAAPPAAQDSAVMVSTAAADGKTEAGAPTVLTVGLLIDPANAFRPVDMGPAANDTINAKAFRAFWGNKSEIRRFQDGSIVEAVVWTVPSGYWHHIVKHISAYALQSMFCGCDIAYMCGCKLLIANVLI